MGMQLTLNGLYAKGGQIFDRSKSHIMRGTNQTNHNKVSGQETGRCTIIGEIPCVFR
jgi:hypothetical protein